MVPPPLRAAARLAPVRPAFAAGARAAAATVVPLLVGQLLNHPEMVWAGLAGFTTTLSDKGGMYRTRAAAMGAVAVGGAAGGLLAALAGHRPVPAVAAMLLWGLLSGLAGAYGPAAVGVGVLTSITFVVSLAEPATAAGALHRAALLLAGGLWALLLGLFLWPIRPYRPARLAVSRCYRAIADFAAEVEAAAEEGSTPQDFARVRAELEAARTTLAEVRRGRLGESPRGERLVVLLESADQMLGRLVGLGDVLESLAMHPTLGREREAVARALRGFADTARHLAAAVLVERGAPDVPVPGWGPGSSRAEGTPEALRPGILRLEYATRLLRALHEYAGVARDAVCGINDDRPVPATAGSASELEPRRPLLEPLLTNLTPDSVVLRHALRVAVTTALAVALTRALALERGYWVTLTVLNILQPYTGATVVKGMQRVTGTVLGGVVAALIAALIRDPWGILATITLLAAIGVALLPLNYALFSVFLTPTFVLLAEVNAGDWHLAGLRIANTLVGGLLALLGISLLWSVPERERFPGQLAAALRASREYLAAAFALLAGSEPPTPGSVEALRRRLGLAILNAEASLQRLLMESVRGGAAEPAMAVLTYLRRLAGALIALAAAPRAEASARQELLRLGAEAERILGELESAVRERRPPAAAQLAVGDDALPPLLQPQVERVARTLTVLSSTLARLPLESAPDPEPGR